MYMYKFEKVEVSGEVVLVEVYVCKKDGCVGGICTVEGG